jgi:broad specificity phosphatase PhoE
MAIVEDPGTTTIYLVRHGRTALNANGQLRGHLDPPLDEVGRAEAKALASVIAPFEPVLVVSSPLLRAVETAGAIADECGLTAEVDDRFVDRDYGSYAGKRVEDVVAQWGSLSNAPGVESVQDIVARAKAALDDVVRRVRPEPAVIVAHDAINRLLLSHLAPGRWSHDEDIPQRTGCLNIVYRGVHRWLVAEVDLMPFFDGDAGVDQ